MFFKIPIAIPESVIVIEFFVTGGYTQGTQSGFEKPLFKSSCKEFHR